MLKININILFAHSPFDFYKNTFIYLSFYASLFLKKIAGQHYVYKTQGEYENATQKTKKMSNTDLTKNRW